MREWIEEIQDAADCLADLRKPHDTEASLKHAAYLIYACGVSTESRTEADKYINAGPNYAFINELKLAVPDWRWMRGWEVIDIETSTASMRYSDILVRVPLTHVEGTPSIGMTTNVRVPCLKCGEQPGFISRVGTDSPAGDGLSRVYLNIQARHAAWVLGALARALNHLRYPYALKCLANPVLYVRSDAAVIYVETSKLNEIVDVVIESIEENDISLEPHVPLLTKKVAQGVALADDPTDTNLAGVSHGQWVSSLLAKAAMEESNARSIATSVKKQILQVGRDLDTPYFRYEHP